MAADSIAPPDDSIAPPGPVTDGELSEANGLLERLTASQRVDWFVDRFGDTVAVSSSFGADSAVMLQLAVAIRPDMPIITVDTGFLFEETRAFREQLTARLELNLHVYRPRISREDFIEEHGAMWRTNPDACCAFNKREPFDRAKQELGIGAWMAGVRRDQSHMRRHLPFVQRDFDGLIKLCPIADWTTADVHFFLAEYDLPYHPLREEGFPSIGCRPEEGYCTRKVQPGEDARSGRWAGFDKTECGLHTFDSGSGI